MTEQAESNQTEKTAAPLRSDVKRLVRPCFDHDDVIILAKAVFYDSVEHQTGL